LKRYILRR